MNLKDTERRLKELEKLVEFLLQRVNRLEQRKGFRLWRK